MTLSCTISTTDILKSGVRLVFLFKEALSIILWCKILYGIDTAYTLSYYLKHVARTVFQTFSRSVGGNQPSLNPLLIKIINLQNAQDWVVNSNAEEVMTVLYAHVPMVSD